MSNHCQRLPSLVAATLLAACGGSSSSTTATVELHPQGGVFDGSAEVLVHTAAGSLVSRAAITTSLDVAITDGDTVTVAVHEGAETALFSSYAVHTGDVIALPVQAAGSAATTTIAVSMPASTDATSYEVGVPNSESESDAQTGLTVEVPTGATTTPIIATALGDTGALAVYAQSAAAISGTGSAATVSLTQTSPFQAVALSAANTPAGLGSDNIFVGAAVVLGDATLGASSVGNTAFVPTGVGDGVEFTGAAFGSAETDIAGTVVASAPASQSIDMSLPDLPVLSQPAIGSAGPTWSLAGGSDYNEVQVGLSASGDESFFWTLTAPPGTTSLVLPVMPSDLAAPTLDTMGVAAIAISSFDGYSGALNETETLAVGTTFELRSVGLEPATADVRRHTATSASAFSSASVIRWSATARDASRRAASQLLYR